MYSLIIDRGLPTEELMWEGNSLAVGLQNFNKEVKSNEPGDFAVIELLRIKDTGEYVLERASRLPTKK